MTGPAPNPAGLGGVHVIPLTAFGAGGSGLNLAAYQQHLARLAAAGGRIFVCGAGTGEFGSLTPEESGALVATAVATVGSQALVFGAIGLGLPHALAGGRAILAAGGHGVMIMPPSGPYLSDAGLSDYYQRLLDTLDCPTAIYRNAAYPTDPLLLDLAADRRVVAVKEATNDLQRVSKLCESDADVAWICGSAERWAPFYALAGAVGFTSGVANLVPRLSLKLQHALAAGDWPEAMRLRRILLPMEEYRAEGATSYNVAALKHAAGSLGLDLGPPRPPMRRLTAAEGARAERLAAALAQAELEECGACPAS